MQAVDAGVGPEIKHYDLATQVAVQLQRRHVEPLCIAWELADVLATPCTQCVCSVVFSVLSVDIDESYEHGQL
jgi:hypothetical protein